MEGLFVRKKSAFACGLAVPCGIFLIAMYVFLTITDPEAPGELVILLIMGIFAVLIPIPLLLHNHGAFVYVGENELQAKYNWFASLDSSLDEVSFAVAKPLTLTILMKNGKRHVIMGLENPWELCAEIRRQIFRPETASPESIRKQLAELQTKRKKGLRWVFGGVALMFALLAAILLWIFSKDFQEFSKSDWILLGLMGIMEAATVIGLFCAALHCGRLVPPMEALIYRLRGAIIASQPLPASKITAVYTDEGFSGRIAVCGFPKDESVYYCVQEINGSFELETVHTSEVFDSADKLPKDKFSPLMDITGCFQ